MTERTNASGDLLAYLKTLGCDEWTLLGDLSDGSLIWRANWPKKANGSKRWDFWIMGRAFSDGSFSVYLQGQRPGAAMYAEGAHLTAELKAMALASAALRD